MKIEMNDFERLTIRYAVYEALASYRDHYCEEEIESLKAVYERLDPTKVEHDKEGNRTRKITDVCHRQQPPPYKPVGAID